MADVEATTPRAHLADLLERMARRLRAGEIALECGSSPCDEDDVLQAVIAAIGGTRREPR